jgi:hypothetical protein
MPIEQSPRFYMAVNLKTAVSLGVSLSDVFIARANEVIEWSGARSWHCLAARSGGRSPARAQQAATLTDGKMLEQLACLVAGHLILQRKRADYWIAGVVIAALRYLGG